MNGSPIPEVIGKRDSEGGQLGLALQNLEAGLAAELEQLEVAGAATAAGRPAPAAQVLDLAILEADQTLRLDDVEHPVSAYLNRLASSSRRPQLSALDWIARRATQLYTAETMPWHQLRRPHVLRIRGLLEEHYQPATANRMLAALRGELDYGQQGGAGRGAAPAAHRPGLDPGAAELAAPLGGHRGWGLALAARGRRGLGLASPTGPF